MSALRSLANRAALLGGRRISFNRTLSSPTGVLLLQFLSDDSVTFTGWRASWSAAPAPQQQKSKCAVREISAPSGLIVEGGSLGARDDYASNEECTFIIDAAAGCADKFPCTVQLVVNGTMEADGGYISVWRVQDRAAPLSALSDPSNRAALLSGAIRYSQAVPTPTGVLLVRSTPNGRAASSGWAASWSTPAQEGSESKRLNKAGPGA